MVSNLTQYVCRHCARGTELMQSAAYNAFVRLGQRDKQWCGNHRINHKALMRAMSIRKQLKRFLERFGIKTISCEGDAKRLTRCLVSGYFKVGVVYCSVCPHRSSAHREVADSPERGKDDA